MASNGYVMAIEAGELTSAAFVFDDRCRIFGAAERADAGEAADAAMASAGAGSGDIASIGIADMGGGARAAGELAGSPIGAPICAELPPADAALWGTLCFARGDAALSLGASGFCVINAGEGEEMKPFEAAYTPISETIRLLRDDLRAIDSAADSEYFALKARETGGMIYVPPDGGSAGLFVGIRPGTDRSRLIRAALDGAAYAAAQALREAERASGAALVSIRIFGRACVNSYLAQTLADLTGLPVLRPLCVEAAAQGAAHRAGLAAGFWKDLDDIRDAWLLDRVFKSAITESERAERILAHEKAVRLASDWRG